MRAALWLLLAALEQKHSCSLSVLQMTEMMVRFQRVAFGDWSVSGVGSLLADSVLYTNKGVTGIRKMKEMERVQKVQQAEQN